MFKATTILVLRERKTATKERKPLNKSVEKGE